MQQGNVKGLEHVSANVEAKRVVLYGYDPVSGEYTVISVDESGAITPGDLGNYKATDQDNSSPQYFGFTRSDGGWYIMKRTTTGTLIETRYIKGDDSYTTNWTNRAALSYDYFYNIF